MPSKLSSDDKNLLYNAFSKNERFLDWLKDEAQVSTYIWFDYVDTLRNIDDFAIVGIQAKLSEIGNPNKLLPTLSELKAAKILAKRGFEVELLLDKDNRFQKPPDLLACFQDLKVLIEVKKIDRDNTEILLREKLQPLLEKRNLILTIRSYPKDLFESTFKLGLDFKSRQNREKIFSSFVYKLIQSLELLEEDQLPYELALQDGSSFSVKIADSENGIFPQVHTPWIGIPTEKYKEKILEKLFANGKKISKRESWTEEFLKYPFLVFLDLGFASEIHTAIFPALYGSITCVDTKKTYKFDLKPVNYPALVMDKLKGKSKKLMLKLGFDSQQRFHISEPGYFVTEESIRENTTGILIMLHDALEYLPNPFCDESIFLDNFPEHLDIPLTLFPSKR